MMPISVTAWLSLGLAVRGSKMVEVSGANRVPVAISGEDALPQINGITGPEAPILFAGLYDAVKGGRLLMHWPLIPPFCLTTSGVWQGEEIRTVWDQPTQHALNKWRAPNIPDRSFAIASGQRLGTVNGQPVTAACRLAVCDGLLMPAIAADARRAPAEAAT